MTLPRRGRQGGFAVYRMVVGDVFYHARSHAYYIVTSTSRRFIGARKMPW